MATLTEHQKRTIVVCAIAVNLALLILCAGQAQGQISARVPFTQTGFGTYAEEARSPDVWGCTVARMQMAGMNTFAFFPTSDANLIDQMEAGVTQGMLRRDIPVVLISNMPPLHPGPDNTNEKEWADMPGRVDAARAKAPHGKDWPEIILYGTDEPTSAKQVVAWADAYHKGGYRATTSLCVPNVKDFIPYLDLLIIHASPGVLTRENVEAIKAAGKEYGIYNVQIHRGSPELLRYWSGLFAWKLQPVLSLIWDWSCMASDVRGARQPGMLEGYRAGVDDYQMLKKAAAYPLDFDFWPGICTTQREAWKSDFNGTAAKCRPENPLVR